MADIIRNVEWIHARTKVTMFEYFHPVSKEWKESMLNGFLEDEEIKKLYYERFSECLRASQ